MSRATAISHMKAGAKVIAAKDGGGPNGIRLAGIESRGRIKAVITVGGSDFYDPMTALRVAIEARVERESQRQPCVSVPKESVVVTQVRDIETNFTGAPGREMFRYRMGRQAFKYLHSVRREAAVRVWCGGRGWFAMYADDVLHVSHDGHHWRCVKVPEDGLQTGEG